MPSAHNGPTSAMYRVPQAFRRCSVPCIVWGGNALSAPKPTFYFVDSPGGACRRGCVRFSGFTVFTGTAVLYQVKYKSRCTYQAQRQGRPPLPSTTPGPGGSALSDEKAAEGGL